MKVCTIPAVICDATKWNKITTSIVISLGDLAQHYKDKNAIGLFRLDALNIVDYFLGE